MSRSGEIVRPFAGEDRAFRLTPTKGWRRVQEKCDAGPPEIIRRLALSGKPPAMPLLQWIQLGGAGTWRIDDVREVILQGLVGGGLAETDATRLVAGRLDGDDADPLIEHVPLALDIALASLMGAPDEPLGEPQGEETPQPASPAAS